MNIKTLEELSLNAWPSLKTSLYDGWVLRFADGYTKRANSVSPLYQSTESLDKKIDECEIQYGLKNLPTIFKITQESYPEYIDKRLEDRGYRKLDETSVRILDLENYHYRGFSDVVAESQFNESWINGYFKCSNTMDMGTQISAKRLLDNIYGKVICVSKHIDGQIVGCGFGAIERDCIGIFDIVVDKCFRGNGYGKDIMDGILSEAKMLGVKTAYLAVVVGNQPAENLYSKIGFTEVYRYWYRRLGTKYISKNIDSMENV